jgi:hypothetical protein
MLVSIVECWFPNWHCSHSTCSHNRMLVSIVESEFSNWHCSHSTCFHNRIWVFKLALFSFYMFSYPCFSYSTYQCRSHPTCFYNRTWGSIFKWALFHSTCFHIRVFNGRTALFSVQISNACPSPLLYYNKIHIKLIL